MSDFPEPWAVQGQLLLYLVSLDGREYWRHGVLWGYNVYLPPTYKTLQRPWVSILVLPKGRLSPLPSVWRGPSDGIGLLVMRQPAESHCKGVRRGGGGGAKWPLGNMQLLPNSFKAARCQEGKKPGVEVDLKPCPDETGAVEPSPSLLRLPLPCFPYWDVAMPPRPPKWDCPDKSYCYLHRYLYNICFDCKSNK